MTQTPSAPSLLHNLPSVSLPACGANWRKAGRKGMLIRGTDSRLVSSINSFGGVIFVFHREGFYFNLNVNWRLFDYSAFVWNIGYSRQAIYNYWNAYKNNNQTNRFITSLAKSYRHSAKESSPTKKATLFQMLFDRSGYRPACPAEPCRPLVIICPYLFGCMFMHG